MRTRSLDIFPLLSHDLFSKLVRLIMYAFKTACFVTCYLIKRNPPFCTFERALDGYVCMWRGDQSISLHFSYGGCQWTQAKWRCYGGCQWTQENGDNEVSGSDKSVKRQRWHHNAGRPARQMNQSKSQQRGSEIRCKSQCHEHHWWHSVWCQMLD